MSVAKESSPEKSKAESVGFCLELDPGRFERDRVQSAIRPSLSEREKGAKGALEIWFGTETDESGGPHPSELNGTEPRSNPAIVDRMKTYQLSGGYQEYEETKQRVEL